MHPRIFPLLLIAACMPLPSAAESAPPLRVATFNTSLNDDAAGGLVRRLETGDDNARKVAAVLQRVRPDLVLLNEFDYDAGHHAADLFQQRYLETPQPLGGAALHYPYRYLAPVNTGVPSGLDLDGDGRSDGPGDAWGFGRHPGQYGMLVLSRYPIDAALVRTFRQLPWSALPDARRPLDPATGRPWHADATWRQLRLSSKSHWDVPVLTPAGTLHFLVAHPTPPVFDGPEDRNGARNADEIGFWKHYLSDDGASPDGNTATWLCDDAGRCGGLPAQARFVIAGDMNNDPADGDGRHDAIIGLLEHPRVLRAPTPASEGGADAARAYAAAGLVRRGAPGHVTGDFGPRTGALRLDYVLPSTGLAVAGSGVFWPRTDDPAAALNAASDHHLAWVDLRQAHD